MAAEDYALSRNGRGVSHSRTTAEEVAMTATLPTDALVVEAERAELVEYLTNVCTFAKRQQHITARFTTDAPTAWDKAHRLMDGPLDDLLALQRRQPGRTRLTRTN